MAHEFGERFTSSAAGSRARLRARAPGDLGEPVSSSVRGGEVLICAAQRPKRDPRRFMDGPEHFPRMDVQVIVVTRLNGPPFAVNPDLVQRIDSAPDTILTLVDGTKYIVQESMHEIIELVNEHRSHMIARAQEIQRGDLESVREGRANLRSAPALPRDDLPQRRDPDDGDRRDSAGLVHAALGGRDPHHHSADRYAGEPGGVRGILNVEF